MKKFRFSRFLLILLLLLCIGLMPTAGALGENADAYNAYTSYGKNDSIDGNSAYMFGCTITDKGLTKLTEPYTTSTLSDTEFVLNSPNTNDRPFRGETLDSNVKYSSSLGAWEVGTGNHIVYAAQKAEPRREASSVTYRGNGGSTTKTFPAFYAGRDEWHTENHGAYIHSYYYPGYDTKYNNQGSTSDRIVGANGGEVTSIEDAPDARPIFVGMEYHSLYGHLTTPTRGTGYSEAIGLLPSWFKSSDGYTLKVFSEWYVCKPVVVTVSGGSGGGGNNV